MKYDVVIAGGGPAGIAASIMSRTGDSTLTVDPALIRAHLKERGVQL